MNLVESIRIALGALSANKLRASLTMLGIVIGVTAVITLMSLGQGAQASITNQVESMGTNLLFVSPGRATTGGVQGAAGSQATLTLEDAQALLDPINAPSVLAVAPESDSFAQVRVAGQNTNTRIVGITPDYESVRNVQVADGDFITQENVDARSLVAVLGANVAQTLFGDGEPVGQSITIQTARLRVIGVLQAKGGNSLGSSDDMVIVPITTLQTHLSNQRTASGGNNISTISVQVVSADQMDAATQQISDILRQRHHITTGQDDFQIISQADTLATLSQITNVLTLFLGAIAGISLLVGGIGIMNIMLVSVTERTREIGIRKAVGAKRRDILMQFLIESGVLSIAGGASGTLLGWLITLAFNASGVGGTSIPNLVVAPDAVILAVGVSAVIGLFFGIYPATRASRLNPIEALRYE